jgi:hypothetical protein
MKYCLHEPVDQVLPMRTVCFAERREIHLDQGARVLVGGHAGCGTGGTGKRIAG